MHNLTDYELMLLIKHRREQALSTMYDRYAGLVYSFARRSVQEESAAREIVQSVFMRLWTTESDYDPDRGQFSSWLLTITRRLAIDWLRKHRRETGSTVPLEQERLDRIPDEANGSPEDRAMKESVKEQIRGAYRYLSAQQIALLEHFYWQGYSLSELAAKYDQPLGTVKNRLHQTLKILRRHLTAEGEGLR